MKIRVPSYYKKFECIASACEDTCCAGWDVVVDEQTYERYQNLEGPFGEKLRSKMVVDEDGDNVFILDGDRCPFLNHKNLCDIHMEQGAEYLCHTCKQYPRYMEDFGGLREMGISLSCPEAARIILGHDNLTAFELIEDEQEGVHALNGEEDILEEFFMCRATILEILEMVDIPLGIKAAMVLRFVQELQDEIDFDEMDVLSRVREKYNNRLFLQNLAEELTTQKISDITKYNDVHEYFKTYQALEHINEKDPLGLNKVLNTYWEDDGDKSLYFDKHQGFTEGYQERMVDLKKILVYFIYRYFMKSFYDYDMSSKIKVAIMSTIMINELAVIRWIETGKFSESDMVDISHSYSKDIEHLEKNVETLEKIFEKEEVYSVDRIINTLMCEF